MNLLDLIILIPMAYLTYMGWKHGIVRELTTLFGILAGIWASIHLIEWVIELLGLEGESAVLIGFFVCFVGALVLSYLLGRCVMGLMKAAHITTLNRVGGAFVGMLKAVCIVAVLLNYVVMVDKREKVIPNETKAKSTLYRPVFITGNALTGTLKAYIVEHKDEWIEEVKK